MDSPYLIYADRNCRICRGSGIEVVIIDTIEVHGYLWNVPGDDLCTCILDKLEGVRFVYYPVPCFDGDDDIPF